MDLDGQLNVDAFPRLNVRVGALSRDGHGHRHCQGSCRSRKYMQHGRRELPWIGLWRRSGDSERVKMFGAAVKDLEGRKASR